LVAAASSTVRLPLSAAAATPEATSGGREAAAVPHRILVVDDNVDAATSLREVLKLNGHAVEITHGAAAALDRFKSFTPEVMLLDIGLPEMDGYELARRIRSSERGSDVLLIAVTGWGQPGDRDRAREAGFDEHMTKPVGLRDLEAALDRGKNNGRATYRDRPLPP